MTWATEIREYLANIQAGLNLSHIITYNGTVSENLTFINDITIGHTGVITVQTGGNTSEAKFLIIKNSTSAYLNSQENLTTECTYAWDFCVGTDDIVNFIYNQSIGTTVEVYFKRG